MLKLFATLALFAVVVAAANAQLVSNPNPPVPAAQAVGGAYTAAAQGAEAPYWNPSGLAYSNGTQGRFAYQSIWGLAFLTHMAAAGSTQLPKRAGGIAVVFQTLGTRDGGYTLAAENEISVSHGIMLQEDIHSSLAFGYTAKIIGYSLGESVMGTAGTEDLGSAATLGFDVGATAQLWDRFRLAGAMKNINNPELGSGLKRQLPRIFSGGLAYTPYYGVRTTFDIERVLSGEAQFKGGVQAAVAKPFDLRFGVNTNPNSFAAGFGLHWRELVVDYAFIYHPVLSPSHLVGIGFNLDQTLVQLWRGE